MEWISVKDRLPSAEYQNVLAVHCEGGEEEPYTENYTWREDEEGDNVGFWFYYLSHGEFVIMKYGLFTHWMSIPEPPKK